MLLSPLLRHPPIRALFFVEFLSLNNLPVFYSLWLVSLIAQLVKNPPARQETQVSFLAQEDLLEKGKATHSSFLAWRVPKTVYSPWGLKESDTTERLSLHFHLLICLGISCKGHCVIEFQLSTSFALKLCNCFFM